MNILDSLNQVKRIDKKNVYSSVVFLTKQCVHAWDDAEKTNIPTDYNNFENIVFTGMGGSGLAARVIESAFFEELPLSILKINDYDIPGFVGSKSLVICSSYSGSTEETIENLKQAINKKAKWIAIGTGGPLIEKAKENKVPYYQIVPKFNPCNQPRMAIGYSIVGQLSLSSKLGLVKISKEDILKTIKVMNKVVEENKIEVKSSQNFAKKLALSMKNKIIVLVSSKHLIGASHVFNNQLNENSKTFSSDFSIPELNHHLMEGLKNPSSNKKNLFFVFINSKEYPEKIQKRYQVTKEVVEKNKIKYKEINLKSKGKLNQVFELIQFGAFVNFYLSILYKQDPAPIPWVDYFKEKLSKT